MPRKSRQKSPLGIYHAIIRGNNRQVLFIEEEDYRFFLDCLSYYKDKDHFILYAYCLMSNHVHLLIQETDVELGTCMKHIQEKYVRWINAKYERIGTLMQGRFKSEPITSNRYFLTVFRYIIQNPMHAGIEKAPGINYPWSSYYAYVEKKNDPTDCEKMNRYFQNTETIKRFLLTQNKEVCLEDYSMYHIPEEEAIMLFCRLTGVKNPYEFQKMSLLNQKQAFIWLKDAGFSISQIHRYTGVSRYVIDQAINLQKEPVPNCINLQKGPVPNCK